MQAVYILNGTTAEAASQAYDIASAFKTSLISSQCVYDPATGLFFIAANNGSHILVARTQDPTAEFVGPFVVQANGLDPRNPGQALSSMTGCLTGNCQASNMEVMHLICVNSSCTYVHNAVSFRTMHAFPCRTYNACVQSAPK